MLYILNPNIALRSWQLVPYAFYRFHSPFAVGLKKEEFELLKQCDGKTELSDNSLLAAFLEKGMIKRCETGNEFLSEWQRYKNCDNRYFPKINWMITGKCNYNCLHCFNAADNAPLMSEWTIEEADKLLDEAQNCGINAFTITGGEPMLHRNFFEILESIYRHGMYVEELNTNGYFINRDILKRMQTIGCLPLLKISFDGIGFHDWMRNRTGAESATLNTIRLCVEEGFPVKVQTNVNRKNLASMLKTAELLNSMGVNEMRIIRTTEAPRWTKNAGDATLKLTEYYDRMMELVHEYIETDCKMEMNIWQFMNITPKFRTYAISPVEYNENSYRDSLPVCKGNRGMIAIGANGHVYPCHQLSGYYEQHNDILGNVKTDGLQTLLQSGKYLCEVCRTVREVRGHDAKCAVCPYFIHCAGGCRAVALALTGDKLAADPSKCLFFEGGYYNKIVAVMEGYQNLTPIVPIQ